MSPSQNHSYSLVGLDSLFPLTLHLVFFVIFRILLRQTPLKTTHTHADVHMHERERDTNTSFLYLEGSLSGELEDNGRHVVKFENEK